jgi:hypothetical protein
MRATAQACFSFATSSSTSTSGPPARRRTRPVATSRGAGRARHPWHVVLRSSDAAWRLHEPRSEAALRAGAAATRALTDFHVFHVSVRGDDVHLLVDAESPAALAAGVHAFTVAASRALQRAAARLGVVFDEDYAVTELRTLAEFREALRCLIGPDPRQRATGCSATGPRP